MMKYLILIFVNTLISCNSTKNIEEDKSQIEEIRIQHALIASSGDADSYIKFITEDAIYLIPDEEELFGKENIKNWVAEAFKVASFKITQHPADEIEIMGDVAYVRYRGSIDGTLKSDSSQFQIERKYLDIWKKVNGVWKVHRHMWNDLPL